MVGVAFAIALLPEEITLLAAAGLVVATGTMLYTIYKVTHDLICKAAGLGCGD
jgi:hypothetical protein